MAFTVTVNELFAGLVSVPLSMADPVTGIVPAAVTATPTVTIIVWPPPRLAALQVTVPAMPPKGATQVPRFVLTESTGSDGGNVVVKTTPVAAKLRLSLTCHVNVSVEPTAGPPFWADPVTCISVVLGGGPTVVINVAELFSGLGSRSGFPAES